MRKPPWSNAENAAILDDYFEMLREELAGRKPDKAEHRSRLTERLDGRSDDSIQYKCRNISAVLRDCGEPWIDGYAPLAHVQQALRETIESRIDELPSESSRPALVRREAAPRRPAAIPLDNPPTLRNQPPPRDLEESMTRSLQFDTAGRAARNRELGKAGEQRVVEHERATLLQAGCPGLAQKVRWVSEEDGDGAGYDISSFEPDGSPRLIEVKTTRGWEFAPFHITRNELAASRERSEAWLLFRVWNFAREPRAFELRPPLERHVSLAPTSFAARFEERRDSRTA